MDFAVVDREFVPFIHKGFVYTQFVREVFYRSLDSVVFR